MSTGQWIGAILGFVVGFIVSGGNIVYAIYGAVIGYTLGGIIDPVKADVKQPGAPAQKGLEVVSNIIGNPIFDVAGTAKITGQLLFFGKEFNRAVWYRPSKGVRAISGYKYYGSWGLGICLGEVDCLYTIFRDQDPIWSGELNRPISGGEATIQVEGVGTVVFYFGTADQALNANVGTTIADASLNTPYRHLCWAFFDSCFMNEYNRMPSMTFIVRKTPALFSVNTCVIRSYDVNPAHALWYALVNKVGLPVEWLHVGDFTTVAQTLYSEGRGISVVFDAYQATQNYLEAINNHVDCILKFGSDGKFHPRLIRNDYNVNLLPLIDVSVLIDEPTFSRKSWIDTINEVKVQYSEIIGATREDVDKYPYIYQHSIAGTPTTFRVLNKGDYTVYKDVVLTYSYDKPSSYVGAVRENSTRELAYVDGGYIFLMTQSSVSPYSISVIKMSLDDYSWSRLDINTNDNPVGFLDGYVVGDSIYFVRVAADSEPKVHRIRRTPLEVVESAGAGVLSAYAIIADPSANRLYTLTQSYPNIQVSIWSITPLQYLSSISNIVVGTLHWDKGKPGFIEKGGFVYFITKNSNTDGSGNGRMVKAPYPGFTPATSFVFPNGGGMGLCLDDAGQFGYAWTRGVNITYFYKVDLATMTITKSTSYSFGNFDGAMTLDEVEGLLYVTNSSNIFLVYDLDLNLIGTYSRSYSDSIFRAAP